MKLESVIEQTKIEPYDKTIAGWCQILNKHRNATHKPLLDALKKAVERQGFTNDELITARQALNAAENVEVPE